MGALIRLKILAVENSSHRIQDDTAIIRQTDKDETTTVAVPVSTCMLRTQYCAAIVLVVEVSLPWHAMNLPQRIDLFVLCAGEVYEVFDQTANENHEPILKCAIIPVCRPGMVPSNNDYSPSCGISSTFTS